MDHADYDVVVVGGGIIGAAAARALTRQGYRILLLEQADFASGSTAASTRLIQGGGPAPGAGPLRQLPEATLARERLLRSRPHLVQPQPLLLPVFAGDGRSPPLVRARLALNDLLTPRKVAPWSRGFSLREVQRLEPSLTTTGLRAVYRFHDALVEAPERLCIAVPCRGARSGGGSAQLRVRGFHRDGGWWRKRSGLSRCAQRTAAHGHDTRGAERGRTLAGRGAAGHQPAAAPASACAAGVARGGGPGGAGTQPGHRGAGGEGSADLRDSLARASCRGDDGSAGGSGGGGGGARAVARDRRTTGRGGAAAAGGGDGPGACPLRVRGRVAQRAWGATGRQRRAGPSSITQRSEHPACCRWWADSLTTAERTGQRAVRMVREALGRPPRRRRPQALPPRAPTNLSFLPPETVAHLRARYGQRSPDVAAYAGLDPELAEPISPAHADIGAQVGVRARA